MINNSKCNCNIYIISISSWCMKYPSNERRNSQTGPRRWKTEAGYRCSQTVKPGSFCDKSRNTSTFLLKLFMLNGETAPVQLNDIEIVPDKAFSPTPIHLTLSVICSFVWELKAGFSMRPWPKSVLKNHAKNMARHKSCTVCTFIPSNRSFRLKSTCTKWQFTKSHKWLFTCLSGESSKGCGKARQADSCAPLFSQGAPAWSPFLFQPACWPDGESDFKNLEAPLNFHTSPRHLAGNCIYQLVQNVVDMPWQQTTLFEHG